MSILTKKLEKQVQFWSLLGPLLLLLGIVILLYKASSHLYLPISVLVGIPLCLKWKLKGLAGAIVFLFTLFFFAFPDLEMDERYWHVGMGMALAFSFVILTLSLEEVESLIGKLQTESQSRLSNFQQLDDHLKTQEKEWSAEKESLGTKVAALTQDLVAIQDERLTLQKLVYLAKDELVTLRTQHEKLMEDLFYKKQQMAILYERLEENEATIQGFVNSEPEKHIKELSRQIDEHANRLEEHKQKSEKDQEKIKQLQERIESDKNEYNLQKNDAEIFNQSNQKLQQIIDQKNGEIEQNLEKLRILELETQKLMKALENEKSKVLSLRNSSQNTRSLDSMYLQLKDQFNEKNEVLHTTRKELFMAQEELVALKMMSEKLDEENFEKSTKLVHHTLKQAVFEIKKKEEVIKRQQEELDDLHSLIQYLLT